MPWAPRLLVRAIGRFVRGVRLVACVWPMYLGPQAAVAEHRTACTAGDGPHIEKVCYTALHDAEIYGHNILGNTPEWNELTIFWGPEGRLHTDGQRGATTYANPQGFIFEDVAPRVLDLNADGVPEVITVQSKFTEGARLLVFEGSNPAVLVANPHIGTRNRWLALLGAADLDGDGVMEMAYIDRPHLAKTLRIWRYENRRLTEVAAVAGFTNHRIGEPDIAGGIRDCGAGPEMILASANWRELVSVTWDGDGFAQTVLGSDTSRAAFASAMACAQ